MNFAELVLFFYIYLCFFFGGIAISLRYFSPTHHVRLDVGSCSCAHIYDLFHIFVCCSILYFLRRSCGSVLLFTV